MNNNIDWIIHLVANGACDECGKEEKGFLPYTCNAHTHGMEKYDHPDFQVILSLPPREIGRILNTLGLRVQEGERFQAGRYVSGIYADCDICALPGFVDSKNEEKTERNAGYLVVSHSGGGMLRQGTRKGIRRTPANRGMRAHWVVKGLDISEDVCHGMCP